MQEKKEFKLLLLSKIGKIGIIEEVETLLTEGVNPKTVDEVDYILHII
jgi:hypothetical protein